MTGDMEDFSSVILSIRMCKSAESLQRFACQIAPQEEITIREIGRTRWPRNVAMDVVIFLEKFSMANAQCTADLRPMFFLKGVSMLSPSSPDTA